jgi:NitT/TauT family transport system substrate-binding protein
VPTFHAVVARQAFTAAHPEVMQAFLESVRDTTDYLNQHPLEATQKVASITGLEPEVVYLYNGPNGLVSFDMTIKPQLVEAMAEILPFLKDLGSVQNLDLGKFVNDRYLRQIFGSSYDAARANLTNPDTLSGTDPACKTPVDDPREASEVWFAGENSTKVAATPTCLLQQIKTRGTAVRAAYVPDATNGTRIFAATATWVLDPGAPAQSQLRPFAARADADAYLASHPGSREVDYPTALGALVS